MGLHTIVWLLFPCPLILCTVWWWVIWRPLDAILIFKSKSALLSHWNNSCECMSFPAHVVDVSTCLKAAQTIVWSFISSVCQFLARCQSPSGGFAGGPGQHAHLAPTYAAVNALCIIGTEEAYNVIDRYSRPSTSCIIVSVKENAKVQSDAADPLSLDSHSKKKNTLKAPENWPINPEI